jgi:hypothetical protein
MQVKTTYTKDKYRSANSKAKKNRETENNIEQSTQQKQGFIPWFGQA